MKNFDDRARSWDSDPEKVRRGEAAAAAIRARVPLGTGLRAFEYGCGTGLLSFALQADLGPITLADSSQAMIEVVGEKVAASGRPGMTPVRLDLLTDPLPPERYDLAYSLMVLHHLSDIDRVLEAFHDLLEPGGILCAVDLDSEDGSFHKRDYTGYKGFDRAELADKARRAGFRNVSVGDGIDVYKDVEGEPRTFSAFLLTAERPA